jgi:hypothetical protein
MARNVAANYMHRDKFAVPRDGIAAGDSQLKWSNVALPDALLPREIEELARDCLKNVRVAGEFSFVILHRCGEVFYFLIVSTWCNENELWESVYAKQSAGEPNFRPFTVETSHRGPYACGSLALFGMSNRRGRGF